MSWQIAAFTRNPLTGDYIYSLLCDTVADLPASITGTDYDGAITQGCTAKIIENGASYTANSSGTWVLQPTSSMTINLPDVYSEAEVDALLAPIESELDNDTEAVTELINYVKNEIILTDVDTGTKKGVTITYNGDGTYTLDSGGVGATGDDYFYLARSNQNPLFPQGYIISGCTGGSDSTYYLSIAGTTIKQYDDAITLSADTSGSLLFNFKSGQIFDNLLIKPMVCKPLNYALTSTFKPHYLKLVQNSIQINFSDLTWTQSGAGMYYSSVVTIPGLARVYSATISGFANLRATDSVVPACNRSGGFAGIRLYANTNSYNTGAWITVACIGELAVDLQAPVLLQSIRGNSETFSEFITDEFGGDRR